MARLESIAIGGFFPTPPHLVGKIAEFLIPGSNASIVDPCAGEGQACLEIAKRLGVCQEIYLCEMEQSRHQTLKQNLKQDFWVPAPLHGDAFQIEIQPCWASVLFLNPPYDLDPIHGRLEQRFLDRFTDLLVQRGILIFLVPYYALEASARTLATHYQDLQCFKFPEPDYQAYSQVVLFASKVETLPYPDPRTLSQIQAWSSNPETIPVLGRGVGTPYQVPTKSYRQSWSLREFDLTGLIKKARPWTQQLRGTSRALTQMLPDGPVQDLMFRQYGVATAPRPAHIASGIASGLFNGRRITSHTQGLPDLLVKGVFDRDYVTIEEKQNKDGVVTSVVQVQQPRLVTTCLDLSNQQYTTLKTSGRSQTREISDFSIEDLMEHYGVSLMQVMSEQCPVLYDPKRDRDSLPLFPTGRKLYPAQKDAAQALLQLLGGSEARNRQGKAAILLGEIGCGKTSVSLTCGATIANRILVLCPPHLLDSWRDETKQILPNSTFRVIQNIQDVDDLKLIPKSEMVVAVLSRETAKLGHSWESVKHSCPKCGSKLPTGDIIKRRLTCEVRKVRCVDDLAKRAKELAFKLARSCPESPRVLQLIQSRFYREWIKKYEVAPASWTGLDPEWVDSLLDSAVQQAIDNREAGSKLLGRLLLACPNDARVLKVIQSLKGPDYFTSSLARALLLLITPESEILSQALACPVFTSTTSSNESSLKSVQVYDTHCDLGIVRWSEGQLTLDGLIPGSTKMAESLLARLCELGKFKQTGPCGEPLFQAIPEPRRFPLAQYIAKRHPDLFDLLIADECHEYGQGDSAQSQAAHRISNLGMPCIFMTGSIMNGYADSLFANMWACSKEFRQDFQRSDKPRFVTRYGYLKRVLTERDQKTGEVLAFGSCTDRVERSERQVGVAPGVLPLFLFQHLLPISVTLHKADLALNLPSCRQIRVPIDPEPALLESYKALQRALIDQIRKDQRNPELSGKLFGALSELPSYLDRATADTGNQPDGSYEIRYPASVQEGALVARGTCFPPEHLSTKELWLLETLKRELAEDRNCMVFSWHVSLLPRLARIISQELGEEVPVLYANKVPTGKRQEWITKTVVKKGRRILVTNPVAIQTGLNNLVHFASEIWMENPAANPTIVRQAVGRVDRIGQKLETRIYMPIFANTLQTTLYDLLLRKVAVATATDGLDPESALIAAGASDDAYLSGLSIGRQLWNLLNSN